MPNTKNGLLPTNYKTPSMDAFNNYWQQGKGEVNIYDLHYERYGESRKGMAILTFTTEDFSKSKQAKLDAPVAADKINVLRINKLYRFSTGLSDYSLMQSVFTPTDLQQEPHSLKTTVSMQDWDGQAFTQLNYKSGKYKIQEWSYLERPSDKLSNVDGVLLEDDVMNRLRIHPESVPTGEVRMIPALFFSRLQLESIFPARAAIRFSEDKKNQRVCKIIYPELKRSLEIWFDKDFPYKIRGWQEKKEDKLVSACVLRKSVLLEFAQKNAEKFNYLRDSLGLSTFAPRNR